MSESEKLDTRQDGNVFVFIETHSFNSSFFYIIRSYLTVKEGIVYKIDGNQLMPTIATIKELLDTCKPSGRYDPRIDYSTEVISWDHKDIQKIFRVNGRIK